MERLQIMYGQVVIAFWAIFTDYLVGRGSPEYFKAISTDVLSLNAVLKEAEETLFARPLANERQERLAMILTSCHDVLSDLQALIKKYESLDSKTQRSWDRMPSSKIDIPEVRGRLTLNVTMLTALIR